MVGVTKGVRPPSGKNLFDKWFNINWKPDFTERIKTDPETQRDIEKKFQKTSNESHSP